MKRLLLPLLGVGIILSIIAYGVYDREFVYTAPEVVEKEVVKKEVVSSLDERIQKAQEAQRAEVEARAQQAYDSAYDQAMLEIELEETAKYRAEIEQREEELQAQSIEYWRDPGNVKRLIVETFPEDARTALAVARCESGFDQGARGPTQDYGVYQIHQPSWDSVAKQKGLDYKRSAYDNIQMARHIYDNAGQTWQDWVCYTHRMVALH